MFQRLARRISAGEGVCGQVVGRSVAATLWRRRWAAVATAVLVALVTVVWLLVAPRKYTATALISVTPQGVLASQPATARELQATVAELARSVPVLVQVREQAGPARTVAQLQDEVRGRRLPGTVLIRIVVTDADARYARDVANAIADVLPQHDPSAGQFRFAGAGRATVPTSFSSPAIAPTLWIGAAAALVLAVAAALLRELVVGTVEERGQLIAAGAAPVLGEVAVPADPSADEAERFRAVRVALEFATSDEPTHTVVVAPVTADAPAGWVAVNLAGALAQVEHRVLVVDADFAATQRHPALKSKGPGLADVLRGEVELRDAVRPGPVSGVNVLPAGRLRGANPANLIELHFHKSLDQIDNEVDLVVVAAPPLSASGDARVMAVGNALVLTVGSGRVRAKRLAGLLAELRGMRLRTVGTVLLTGPRGRLRSKP